MIAALLAGLVAGFLVAAEVGPIWLLVARTALRQPASAFAIGAGAATIDMTYAALGAAGAAPLLQIDALRVTLGLAGAAVLALIAVRTLASAIRVRAGAELESEVRSPRAAYLTALAATASNPLTIASWAAFFSAAATAEFVTSLPTTIALVLGVGLGALSWMSLLAFGMHHLGKRTGTRVLRTADVVAGTGLLFFAGLLGWRALRES